MRVIFLVGCLNTGGVEIRTREVLADLACRGQTPDLAVYAISGLPGVLDDDYRRLGAEVIYGRPGLLGLIHLWRLLRQRRPQVIHSNVSTASGYFLLAARLAGVPKAITHYRSVNDVRPGLFHRLKGGLGRFLSNRLSDHIIGVCSAIKEYSRAPDHKWAIAYDGIAVAPGQRVAGPGPRVAYLGRLSPEKNPVRAVAIMQAVAAHPLGANARLRMAGGGSDEMVAALRNEIEALGMRDRVELLGNITDPLGFLRESDVLVLPSLREGLPGAVLEAISVGTPVVAADLPGVREIAAITGGVRCLSLDQSDADWAETIMAVAGTDPVPLIDAFSSSPFLIKHHADQMVALWGLEQQRRTG